MRPTAIWIDQEEARVFHLDGATLNEHVVQGTSHHVHRHPKNQETKIRNHPQDERRFFDDVVATLDGGEGILFMGPSVTKLRFLRYVEQHAPAIAARVVGIETADHPTDRQIGAHLRHYFNSDLPRLGFER